MSFDRQKHIAPQATAKEISEAVSVTEMDRRIVRKVLVELGYLPEPMATHVIKPAKRRTKIRSL
jgi:hypothetical protein